MRANNKTKRERKEKRSRRAWIWLLVVAILLLVGMGYEIKRVSDKAAEYASREAELESMIAEEEGRAYELKEQSKWQQTLKYIEMIAREKLGLVYPDEVILKPDD
ncbi:MAG: septum formation initiator family protein [Lachnospiraceae bacterium]|nr:septum formation initiator family protein [Lachnospiraceae bacterium]